MSFEDEAAGIPEEDEFILDEVNGSRNRKPKMALLNKKKVSDFELDDLLNGLG